MTLQLNRENYQKSFLDLVYVISHSHNTIKGYKTRLNLLREFLRESYGINEYNLLDNYKENKIDIIKIFKEFVVYMDKTNRSPRTIRNALSVGNGYLRHMGIKIDSEDLKQVVKVPKIVRIRELPLDKEIITRLLRNARPKLHLAILVAASPFLFEYENDIHQSTDLLKIQLDNAKDWLKKQNSNKIIVPVIDMNIQDENLFLKKLYFLSKDYNRINVIYRSPNQRQSNWANLKSFLKGNEIWCHMDCVLNRYNNERIAHRVRLYSIGILSTSIGYPFGGSSKSPKKNKILRFNLTSHKYEIVEPPHLPSFAEKQDRTWINSLNKEIEELQKMREHVIEKTLYTNYIPSKGSQYLAFSEGI